MNDTSLPTESPLPARRAAAVLGPLLLAAALLGAGCGRQEREELKLPVRYGQAEAAEAVPAGARRVLAPADAVLLYRRGGDPCEVLLAAPAGLAAGACGDELSPRLYTRPERADRVQELALAYAPFEIEAEGEEVEFHGVGTQVPSAAEQRMVLELARRLMTESLGLRRAKAYRLAFAWHRQGTGERPCDDLAIYLSGEVEASSCAYRGVEITGSLGPEQLGRVYNWVDRLEPFQVEDVGAAEAQGGERELVATRVIFVGRGEEAPGDEVGEISRFAQELYRTMTDEELARAAAEREREEERRLLEAQQAAGLVPPPVGGQRTPAPAGQEQAQAPTGQGQAGQGQQAAPEPLPPVEPTPPPPPAAVGLEEQEEVADPGPDEEEPPEDDGGGTGDDGGTADEDDGGE